MVLRGTIQDTQDQTHVGCLQGKSSPITNRDFLEFQVNTEYIVFSWQKIKGKDKI